MQSKETTVPEKVLPYSNLGNSSKLGRNTLLQEKVLHEMLSENREVLASK